MTLPRLLAAFALLGSLPLTSAHGQALQLVRDVVPGSQSSAPQSLIDVNGTLFFSAGATTATHFLWKSDGTETGTVLVKDVALYTLFDEPDRLVNLNGVLYFVADDGLTGRELWRSDGTTAGTVLVKDVYPGVTSSEPRRLTAAGAFLYFHAATPTGGRELWRSDGTPAGTVMVKDIVPGTGDSVGQGTELVFAGGVLYFPATGKLWRSDGTGPGTIVVRDVGGPSSPERLTAVQNVVFFSGFDSTHGRELWKTDGTAVGTVMVKDVLPGLDSTSLNSSTAVGGTLFFNPSSLTTANQLWKSDGTEAGTVLVKDVYPGSSFPDLNYFTAFQGQLYFRGQSATSGLELWKSDGTEAGTVLIDFLPGSEGSAPHRLTVFNGALFFMARSSTTSGFSLWKTDGAAAPVRVQDSRAASALVLVPSGARLYLNANSPATGYELWALLPLTVPAAATVPEGNSGTTSASVTLTLPAPSDRDVSLDFTTEDGTAVAGTDYLAASGTVVFPPGVLTRTIDVVVVGDTAGEYDETFRVRLSQPVHADPTHNEVTVTIANDDPPGFTVSDLVVTEGHSGPVSATFRVDLVPPAPGGATVSYATADGTATAGSDYTAATGVLNFAPGQVLQTVSVAVLDDTVREGAETFLLNLSSPTGGTVVDGQAVARILDPPGGMDFNGDRRTDLVWRHDVSGQNVVWFMNGVDLVSGTFTDPATLADTRWKVAGTNDFNSDGRADLLWRHEESGENVVWLMNGVSLVSGTFTTPSALADVRWKMVGTGDFNLDGQPDILWRHDVSGENVLWHMNGTVLTSGTFTTPASLADVRWKMAGVGDFNRDGKPDVLWHHTTSGQLVLWYMDGSVMTGGTFTTPAGLSDVDWRVVAVGDYNADERPDIVWRHQTAGQNVVWFMNDATLLSGAFTNPSTLADPNWKLVGPR